MQNLKFQYSMTKTGLEFRILVIVICLIFVVCDLEFLVLLYSSRLPHEKKTIETPYRGGSKPIRARILYSHSTRTAKVSPSFSGEWLGRREYKCTQRQ